MDRDKLGKLGPLNVSGPPQEPKPDYTKGRWFVIREVTVQEYLTGDGLECKPIHGKPWEEMSLDYSSVISEAQLERRHESIAKEMLRAIVT